MHRRKSLALCRVAHGPRGDDAPALSTTGRTGRSGVALHRPQIERKKDFDSRFFTKRVPRCIPAPSVPVPRVRAVVSAFADLTDTKTKKPLFDDKARKKVDAFLEEIKLGHSLLRHAWHCVLQVQARQAQKGYKGRGRPRLA